MQQLDSLAVSHYDGLRLYLLAVGFIPYLLFDRSKPALLFLGIFPTLLSLLFFDYWFSLAGIGFEESGIEAGGDYSLMWMRSIVGYAIISMGCFFFQGIIIYNDKLNETLLTKVRLNSQEIERQNEELKNQQAQLNELNKHLGDLVDQKTRNIKLQNEMLIRYSYTNAHKVRGPVARILGLIQVSKMDSNLDYTWFFNKVESETKTIDEIVKGIARELDNTVGDPRA
jgi:signal transduction histidine kinase